ncbi:MAG TPA: CHAT domain-containing protein, partial [Thermoanaerobaculia bacterium]|nr:CHAT domain-containing protein [Thermoanaerobaculia bacterium]
RTSYLTTVASYYDLDIDLLQQRGRTADAYAVSERARARVLLESLAESAWKIRKGVDPVLLERERDLRAELNAKDRYRAEVVLKEGEGSARAVALAKTVEQRVADLAGVRAKIRETSPAYAALAMPEPMTVDDIQRTLLDDNTSIVAFHLGDSRSYAWVIDRKSISVHALPRAAAIDKLAREYHELLSRDVDAMPAAERDKLSSQISLAARHLADVVWKPIAKRARSKRLLIIADGALQYVPFASLPSSSGEPLIVQHEIVYLPSASVLKAIRRERRPATARTALVFADPVFSADDPRVGGNVATDGGGSARGGPYSRLRFSRAEAEEIAAIEGRKAVEALDFSAAKRAIVDRDLRPYSIIHFATHGYVDTQQPELSGLVLSLVDEKGKPVDGFLHLYDIYNLDLDAQLVVLSACRTALGKEVHGEGLIGLTRGFMYAGAARVVSTIWNVDDRASARLMSTFYDAMLVRKMTPAAALRAAQLSLLRQPRWSNAHYWAAFGLQGEWR